MTEESVNFYSENYKLEGVLSYNDNDIAISTGNENSANEPTPQYVLLCSPHPNLGGDMENNVILALEESLTKTGYTTLRFNYRGVGESESQLTDIAQKYEYWESTMDSEAYGEFTLDVKSALDFLRKTDKLNSELPPVYIVGYSFGGVLSLRTMFNEDSVEGVACISMPFGKYDLQFVETLNKPKYFICSDGDFAATMDDAKNGFEKFANPKQMEFITDCDHFYRGDETSVAEKVANYFKGLH